MARLSAWTPRKIDTAISLYAAGFPLDVVAKAVKVNISTVHRLLSRTCTASIPACVSPAQRLAILQAQGKREESLKTLAKQKVPVDLR